MIELALLFIGWVFYSIYKIICPDPPPPKTGWETDEESLKMNDDMLNM